MTCDTPCSRIQKRLLWRLLKKKKYLIGVTPGSLKPEGRRKPETICARPSDKRKYPFHTDEQVPIEAERRPRWDPEHLKKYIHTDTQGTRKRQFFDPSENKPIKRQRKRQIEDLQALAAFNRTQAARLTQGIEGPGMGRPPATNS